MNTSPVLLHLLVESLKSKHVKLEGTLEHVKLEGTLEHLYCFYCVF